VGRVSEVHLSKTILTAFQSGLVKL
jgi:hypothetical protein